MADRIQQCPKCDASTEDVRAFDWVSSDGLWKPTKLMCLKCDHVWDIRGER